MINGMNRGTGQRISEADHLRQSLHDILTTPVGSRLMRRDYGSLLPFLIDQPATPKLLMQIRASVIHAILNWERRVKPQRIGLTVQSNGQAELLIDYQLVRQQARQSQQARLVIGEAA